MMNLQALQYTVTRKYETWRGVYVNADPCPQCGAGMTLWLLRPAIAELFEYSEFCRCSFSVYGTIFGVIPFVLDRPKMLKRMA